MWLGNHLVMSEMLAAAAAVVAVAVAVAVGELR